MLNLGCARHRTPKSTTLYDGMIADAVSRLSAKRRPTNRMTARASHAGRGFQKRIAFALLSGTLSGTLPANCTRRLLTRALKSSKRALRTVPFNVARTGPAVKDSDPSTPVDDCWPT